MRVDGREGIRAAPCRAPRSRACRITARAARTTPRPWCRKARARWAASAAITWSTWMDREHRHLHADGRRRRDVVRARRPFTDTPHVFQNLGDGTYFHSGSLAIRQSVAAGVNITYKILYNDAVAMTGGQPVDGTAVGAADRAPGAQRRRADHRAGLRRHRRSGAGARSSRATWSSTTARNWTPSRSDLREIKGTTVLIYDQTCATEKRRRRKRGKMVDPAKRVMVNTLVCEGCGDCGKKSFCVSVLPKETEFGRKREIDQSNCNKDYSCVERLLPELRHGRRRRPEEEEGQQAPRIASPGPAGCRRSPATSSQPWNILITGVGGTGVVTIGAAARHGRRTWKARAPSVLDQTGLAQKGGAVDHATSASRARRTTSHAPCASPRAKPILVLGCDMVVVNDYWALSKVRAGRTQRRAQQLRGACRGTFTTQPGHAVPGGRHRRRGEGRAGRRASPTRCRSTRTQLRHRADGRRHRHQPVHPRLRLAAAAWCRCRWTR